MKLWEKIAIGVIVVFVLIQFVRPEKNMSSTMTSQGVTQVVNVTTGVQRLLKTACYDCHSNNTNYPWYSNIQPIGWWLANHIKEGKRELNFDEFASYSKRRQQSKLKAIAESIKDGSMPLSSYMLIHRNAKLSKDDEQTIIDWAEKAKDSLSIINE
jgi:hypothetical protein